MKRTAPWRPGIESLEARRLLAGEPLLISEFMAANVSVLEDRFRNYSDWIELYNPTDQDVDLEGWSLTDDPAVLDKWVFPEESIAAQKTLVVFASGRDRSSSNQHHTNFQLTTDGEYLALVRPDGSVAHEYAPFYPEQRGDVSFGIPFDDDGPRLGEQQYFVTPTPGAENTMGAFGFATPPVVSVERGFFEAPFQVSVTTSTPFGQIRFTTDGSVPTADRGELYTGPITIDTTTTLRTTAFADGAAASTPTTQTYIFLDDVLTQDGNGLPSEWGFFDDRGPRRPARMKANYDVDPEVVEDPLYRDTIKDDLRSIPTLSIVLDPDDLWSLGSGIYSNPESRGDEWEKPVSLEWINTDGETEFATQAGIKIHGGWARRFSQTAKLSFRVVFQGQYGPSTLKYPMFGPDAATEFSELVLRGGFNDSWRVSGSDNTYLQDPWTRATQLDMGGYAPRQTFVQLYLNGMYWGLYSPTERPNGLWAANYRGGNADEYDVINTGGNVVDGDSKAWSQLTRALSPRRFDYDIVKEMVDIDGFIDYLIVNQYVGNWDWPHNNWYASRQRVEGAKWLFHSWDAEAAFQRGSAENRVAEANVASAVGPSNLYLALKDVPEFQRLYADRIYKHFFGDGALTSDANAERLRSLATEIDRAIVGESARWGDGKDDNGRPATRDRSWIRRIDSLADSYFPSRLRRILDQYRDEALYSELDPPEYAPRGGHITPNTDIQLTAPEGDIFYTVDGTDPLTANGQPSDSAIRSNSVDLVTPDDQAKLLVPTAVDPQNWQATDFNDDAWTDGKASFGYDTGVAEDPITVPQGFEVRQTLASIRLSTMTEAEAVLGGQDAIKTVTATGVPSLNYQRLGRESHFEDSSAFPVEGDNFVLDINGKLLVKTPGTYTFGVTSNDGAKLLIDGQILYADDDRHSNRDTFVTTELTADEHDVNLVMFQRAGSATLEFYYAPGEKTEFDDDFLLVGDQQHRPFDGLFNSDLQATALDKNASAYARIPFTIDNPEDYDRLQLRIQYDDGFIAYINGTEVARSAAPDPAPFDATATGTRGDVAVLQQQLFDIANLRDVLTSGDNLLAIHSLNRAATDADLLVVPKLVAFLSDSSLRLSNTAQVNARVLTGGQWSPLTEANFSLAVPADRTNLRISEVNYHPADPNEAEVQAGFTDGNDFEFVELVNISDQLIDLSDVAFQREVLGGKLKGIAFEFTEGNILELRPGERVLVTEDVAAFEFRYGPGRPVAGQWAGGLSNSSETITLATDVEIIHRFAYRDQWYPTTDGGGLSLERIDPTDSNLDRWANADAWRPSSVSGGSPGTPGDLPGDANHDGIFDSNDLILVLQGGEFEDQDDNNSTWEEGDWDGDGDFTTLDLVLAFSTGLFEVTGVPLAIAAAVVGEDRWTRDRTDESSGTSLQVKLISDETLDAIALRRTIEPAIYRLIFSDSNR